MTPDQRGDLVREADRRDADQLPGPAHPHQEADHHQGRDRVHVAGSARVRDHARSLDHLEHEGDGQPDQEQRITHGAPLDRAQLDQRQQRSRHEGEPDRCHDHRGHPDLVPGDQREQRHRQRVDERRQRRRRAYPVQLRGRLGAAETLGGHRDGHEQQPGQGPGHPRARQEEVMDAGRYHPAIVPAGRPGPRPGQAYPGATGSAGRSQSACRCWSAWHRPGRTWPARRRRGTAACARRRPRPG